MTTQAFWRNQPLTKPRPAHWVMTPRRGEDCELLGFHVVDVNDIGFVGPPRLYPTYTDARYEQILQENYLDHCNTEMVVQLLEMFSLHPPKIRMIGMSPEEREAATQQWQADYKRRVVQTGLLIHA